MVYDYELETSESPCRRCSRRRDFPLCFEKGCDRIRRFQTVAAGIVGTTKNGVAVIRVDDLRGHGAS